MLCKLPCLDSGYIFVCDSRDLFLGPAPCTHSQVSHDADGEDEMIDNDIHASHRQGSQCACKKFDLKPVNEIFM